MIQNEGILYIEPSANISAVPVIDELTRKMTAALRQGIRGPNYRGWHTCACGACSSNADFKLPNGEWTNSLSVHYLAFHRVEVSEIQLKKVAALNFGEETPNQKELAGPKTCEQQEPKIWRNK